jgi:hypothetical protein
MKTGSFIAAVLVLLLTLIPCCSFDNCEAEIGANDIHIEESSSEECDHSCSPFLNCGNCTGFVVYSSGFNTTEFAVVSKLMPVDYISGNTNEVIPAIWQPPRPVERTMTDTDII